MKTFLTTVACVACCIANAPDLSAAQPPDEAAVPLVTRFYDVSQLVVSKPQFPFTGKLPASSASTTTPPMSGGLGGLGGLGGGGGFGGMSSSGSGGGFFSVPAAAQFGGGAGGGGLGSMGGGGGFGGGGFDLGNANPAAEAEYAFLSEWTTDGIADLIEETIAVESWESAGGTAAITPLGNTLLVRQSEAVHGEIREFLRELTAAVVGIDVYNVEVWWIPANAAERTQLDVILARDPADAEIQAALSSLAEEAGGYHGRLLCRERTTAHLASGRRRPLVVGSIPVVGGESALAQPVVNHVNLGLTLEATVIPVAEYLLAAGGEAAADEALYLNLRTAITAPEDPAQIQRSGDTIDRFDIGANVLETACRIELGRAALIGTLTSVGIGPLEGTDSNETAVVVQVTRR